MSQKISIETAYNVEFEYNLSNVWDRVWAFLIDSLIKIGYIAFILIILSSILDELPWIVIIFLLPYVFYSLIFEIFNDGQTPGKKAMQLKVISLDGRNLQTSQVVTRWFLRFFDFLLFSTSVAFLAVISTKNGQRIGDLAANTTVISLKDKTNINKTSKVKLPKDYEGRYPQVSKLKDEEIELIKEVIRDNSESSSKVRLAMSNKMESYLGIPKDQKAKEYLKMIVYDFNYFIMLEAGEITPPSKSDIFSSEEE